MLCLQPRWYVSILLQLHLHANYPSFGGLQRKQKNVTFDFSGACLYGHPTGYCSFNLVGNLMILRWSYLQFYTYTTDAAPMSICCNQKKTKKQKNKKYCMYNSSWSKVYTEISFACEFSTIPYRKVTHHFAYFYWFGWCFQ